MPRLIKDGIVCDDRWQPAAAEAPNSATQICTLEQWQSLADKAGSAVQLEPGDGVEALLADLDKIALVSINFPVFTDGRGFSYARELRERGFEGELRATGNFLRDQLTYLRRVGFNAFAPANADDLDNMLAYLNMFSEYYQASVDQPLPLFRRRA